MNISLKEFNHTHRCLSGFASDLGLSPGIVPKYIKVIGERKDFVFGVDKVGEESFTYVPCSKNLCPIDKLIIFNT